jgi:uncharacterized alpha-E superfamily protein
MSQSQNLMMAEPDSLPLLSRVAETVYWTARYIERAENIARYITVNLSLQLDLPMEPADQWRPLIDITGDLEKFEERYDSSSQADVLEFLTHDGENPNSIFSCLRAARENARSVREAITPSMWEQINSMYLEAVAQQNGTRREWPIEECQAIRMGCHLFQGITDATMTHDETWHFVRMGRKLERADQTSRILDVKYFMLLPSASYVGTPYDDIHWSAVLTSVSGFEMYRRRYGRISPSHIVDFLVMDREFPRSIHFCIRCAGESLHAITGTPIEESRYPSEQLMRQLQASLDRTVVEGVLRSGLHEYLDGLQAKMNTIGIGLRDDFFARRAPEALQSQSQSQGASNN